MKRAFSLFAVSLLLISLLGAVGAARTAQDLVAELKPDIESITGMELNMEMDMGEEFLLIDVRDTDEFAGGRLPGATHVNFGKLFFTIQNYVEDKDTHFIIYCAVGARSTIAASILQDLGYTNLVELDGGFNAWLNSGYPVETIHGLLIQY